MGDSDQTGGNTTLVGAAPFMDTPSVGGLNSRNKPFVGLATTRIRSALARVAGASRAKTGDERERDDATLGLPTAFPSLGVAPRGVYL